MRIARPNAPLLERARRSTAPSPDPTAPPTAWAPSLPPVSVHSMWLRGGLEGAGGARGATSGAGPPHGRDGAVDRVPPKPRGAAWLSLGPEAAFTRFGNLVGAFPKLTRPLQQPGRCNYYHFLARPAPPHQSAPITPTILTNL
jgi:hypothetical protein